MSRSRGELTELRIPADATYVMVAKRTAGALASNAGFSLDEIDDINIAIAQACVRTIAAGERIWGAGNGTLRVSFRVAESGMEVEVRGLPTAAALADEAEVRREEELARRTAALGRAQARFPAAPPAQPARRRSGQAVRMATPAAAAATDDLGELGDVAVNMIRLFMDDLRYRVDARGSVRMRMVKYLVQ